jgi:hypothetical protein
VRTDCIIIILVAGVLPVNSSAALFNPGFESYVYDPALDCNVPTGWTGENYTAVVQKFVPNPAEGAFDQWKIDIQQGLEPFEGNSFVLLSTGNVEPYSLFASLRQDVYFSAGETLSGVYFFGTLDYSPYPDYATIKLLADPNSGQNDITLVQIDVEDVGNFSSSDGWVPFQSPVFNQNTAGTYTLELAVYDSYDELYTSYLAVDGLVPEPATFVLLGLGAALLRKRMSMPTP